MALTEITDRRRKLSSILRRGSNCLELFLHSSAWRHDTVSK